MYVLNNWTFVDNKNNIQKSVEDLKNQLFDFTGSVNISTCAYIQTQKEWPLKKNLVRWKIIILNSIMEQESHFRCLGCDVPYKTYYRVNYKLYQFQEKCIMINRI